MIKHLKQTLGTVKGIDDNNIFPRKWLFTLRITTTILSVTMFWYLFLSVQAFYTMEHNNPLTLKICMKLRREYKKNKSTQLNETFIEENTKNNVLYFTNQEKTKQSITVFIILLFLIVTILKFQAKIKRKPPDPTVLPRSTYSKSLIVAIGAVFFAMILIILFLTDKVYVIMPFLK